MAEPLSHQPAVDFPAPLLAERCNHAEDVELHAVLRQVADSLHHPLESGAALAVGAEAVVDFGRAVQAHAHQEAVFGQEAGPVAVKQQGVGLQRVGHRLAPPARLHLAVHRLAIEVQPGQGGFAALPGEDAGREAVAQVVRAHPLQDCLRHHFQAAVVAQGLVRAEVEAVAAVEVTEAPDRLDQQGERFCRIYFHVDIACITVGRTPVSALCVFRSAWKAEN